MPIVISHSVAFRRSIFATPSFRKSDARGTRETRAWRGTHTRARESRRCARSGKQEGEGAKGWCAIGGGGGGAEEEEEEEDEPEEASKRGAPVGGYRENEARHRVPHGPFSRHEARQRPQQPGPERWGPARRTRARDRDNDRREPHTRLAHVRAARAVNTNRVFSSSALPPSSCSRGCRRCCCCWQSPSRLSVSFSWDSATTGDGGGGCCPAR